MKGTVQSFRTLLQKTGGGRKSRGGKSCSEGIKKIGDRPFCVARIIIQARLSCACFPCCNECVFRRRRCPDSHVPVPIFAAGGDEHFVYRQRTRVRPVLCGRCRRKWRIESAHLIWRRFSPGSGIVRVHKVPFPFFSLSLGISHINHVIQAAQAAVFLFDLKLLEAQFFIQSDDPGVRIRQLQDVFIVLGQRK